MSRLQTTRTVPVIGALLLAIPCYAPAGGQLETVDVTAAESSFPPYVDGDLIPIQWDARCVPVHYTLRDANLDQVAGGAPAVESAIVAAMKSWNDIPTSYIEFVFDGTDSKAPTPGNFGAFDLVNEIHFNAMGPFLGASPSIALAVDTTMTLTTDLNGDGTPDTFDPAVAGRGDCHDVDGDGDIEFPIGDYKAGTILDNDTLYASPARVNWAQDFFPPFVDLEGVIVHELGHSHGLSHSFINQQNIFSVDDGPFDGTSVTMFPFVDTGDPLDQLSSRSLALDDVAWSSLVYPEGSGASGPAALGPDDIDFDDVFGIISGTITHGKQDMPLAGAHVTALRGSIDQGDESNVDTRDVGPENSSNTEWLPMPHIVGGFSGTTRVGVTASEGLPSDVSAGLALVGPQSFHIVDGNYRIPAPKGPHKVIVEPVDGLPAGAGSISVTAILGDIFDQLDFNEGFVVKPNGKRRIVHVTAGNETDGIDHTTDTTQVNVGAGSIRFAGSIVAPPNRVYAVAIPGSELTAWQAPSGKLDVIGARFFSFVSDASIVPVFKRAMLVPGTVDGAAPDLDLAEPIFRLDHFIGQDTDFSPLYFDEPREIGDEVVEALDDGATHIFLVLELTDYFPGFSMLPPLIGLSQESPNGLSFFSDDGGATYTQVTTFDFAFQLVVKAPPGTGAASVGVPVILQR